MELMEKQHELSRLARRCPSCIKSQVQLNVCNRCEEVYCPHFASSIDFQFCAYCFHDVVLEDTIIKRTEETTSLSGKKKFTRVMRARHIVFTGQDWMFAQQRILTLSDDELAKQIEYHHTIYGEMLNEREARRITKNKAALTKMMRNASLKIPAKNGVNTDGTPLEAGSSTITTTTVKRTRVTVQAKQSTQSALTALVNLLKAQGLSQEDIAAKIMQMAGKKG